MRLRNHRFLTFSRSLSVLFPYRPLLPLVSVPVLLTSKFTQIFTVPIGRPNASDVEFLCEAGFSAGFIFLPALIIFMYQLLAMGLIDLNDQGDLSYPYILSIYIALTNP